MAEAQAIQSEKDQLACTYAALILHDDGMEVTAEKIATLVKTAGVNVNPYFPKLWARVLSGRSIDELITATGSAAAGPAVAAEAAPAAAAAPATEEKKKEKSESDEGGGGMGGLFGDDEDF
eukprot:TRINITY_DN380_c0_g6_i1.p1 TRINITY_DN380_c0_g6~~TRINITY_DN380_c0_g6_i1.p1  ORF type:complete len:121 (-),score=55.10 TRINITY_DN380_c0_g6_i1:116-478(-)